MDFAEIPLLLHWLYSAMQILQRFFIVIIAALIAIRFERLRQGKHNANLKWSHQFLAILVFAALAIIATHGGIIYEVQEGWRSINYSIGWPTRLEEAQAIISLRDTITLISGLIGGPWVGLGTGLIAGADRCYLGGLASIASLVGTTVLGIFAGCIRFFKPFWVTSVINVFWVALVGTLLHRFILLMTVKPFDAAVSLTMGVITPIAIANTTGCCFMIFWVMKQLDRYRIEKETKEVRLLMLQAELCAFRAQTKPHFLKNALGDISALIPETSHRALNAISELSAFFADTLTHSGLNTISLNDELEQLHRYIELKRLSRGDELAYSIYVPDELLSLQVAPSCLLTLIENALDHGLIGCQPPYLLSVSALTQGEDLLLKVSDNGCGIKPELRSQLGKQPVSSKNKGGGVALHQLMQSLKLVFGDTVDLRFESNIDKGTVVHLRHPKRYTAC